MSSNQQNEQSVVSNLKKYSSRIVRNENFVLAIVLLVIMVVANIVTKGIFFTPTNITNMLLRSSIVGIAAVGQSFVVLSAGIDLAIGGVASFCGCLGASILTMNARLNILPGDVTIPMAAGLAIMILAGVGIGAGNGVLISRLRAPALIVTLGMWQIAKGAAYDVTTGGETVKKLPESLAFFGQGNVGGVPVPIIVFIVAIVVGYLVLNYTSFGRAVYAVGGSEVSAWLSGIKTKNTRFWVYVISGLCAAVAAILLVSRIMCASKHLVYGLEIDSIAAVVIGGVSLFGGKGSMIGVLIGVLILGVIDNAMNLVGLVTYTQLMVKGGVIFAAVAINTLRRR